MLPKDKSLPHLNYMHCSLSGASGPLGWWFMGGEARPALLLGFVGVRLSDWNHGSGPTDGVLWCLVAWWAGVSPCGPVPWWSRPSGGTINSHTASPKFKYFKIAFNNPASESPTGEGTRNAPRLDPTSDGDSQRCHDNSTNFFFINFCNIHGLRSNFHSFQHHLSSSKPHLLFLTETQVLGATDRNLYSVPSYCLYSQFKAKAGCCVYVRNDVLYSRAPDLDSSEY